MKKTYGMEVDCANCAAKMEREIQGIPGVRSAVINFMALRLSVEFEDGCDHASIMKEALRRCRRVERDCEIYF